MNISASCAFLLGLFIRRLHKILAQNSSQEKKREYNIEMSWLVKKEARNQLFFFVF